MDELESFLNQHGSSVTVGDIKPMYYLRIDGVECAGFVTTFYDFLQLKIMPLRINEDCGAGAGQAVYKTFKKQLYKKSMEWVDANIKRPEYGDKVITEGIKGFFWGIFSTVDGGGVKVEGSNHNWVYWEDINKWILYPKDEN